MQLGKKSKTTDLYERVRGEMGADSEESAPLVSNTPTAAAAEKAPSARASSSQDRNAIHVTLGEKISAKLARDGSLKSFDVTGDLQLRISDSSLTKVRLELEADINSAQFRTHPNVDKSLFTSSKAIQLKDPSRGFPTNNSVGVLRWKVTAKPDDTSGLPILFTVWVNKGSDDTYTITVEYELGAGGALKDVLLAIPYGMSDPSVSSSDAKYDILGDSVQWSIGTVDEENSTGSFEFEAEAEDENDFFPMQVNFSKVDPFANMNVSVPSARRLLTQHMADQCPVQVASATLLEMEQDVPFSKDIKCVADSYLIE